MCIFFILVGVRETKANVKTNEKNYNFQNITLIKTNKVKQEQIQNGKTRI